MVVKELLWKSSGGSDSCCKVGTSACCRIAILKCILGGGDGGASGNGWVVKVVVG